MKFPHFFIDRPIFAGVISVLILVVGLIATPERIVQIRQNRLLSLNADHDTPYVDRMSVAANYPGANAETLAETVAAPIEEAINGVENMLYMSSSSTGDGTVQITVTFKAGVDADQAQVLVQNRVASAEPRQPEQTRQLGVTTIKNSPNFKNYVGTQVIDRIARVPGVGNAQAFGARDYNMRIWIDPDRAAARNLTVDEITAAVRAQNQQAAAGSIGSPPFNTGQSAFQLGIQAKGRLANPEERPRRAGGGELHDQFLPERQADGGGGRLPAAGLQRLGGGGRGARRAGPRQGAVPAGHDLCHPL